MKWSSQWSCYSCRTTEQNKKTCWKNMPEVKSWWWFSMRVWQENCLNSVRFNGSHNVQTALCPPANPPPMFELLTNQSSHSKDTSWERAEQELCNDASEVSVCCWSWSTILHSCFSVEQINLSHRTKRKNAEIFFISLSCEPCSNDLFSD